jgi:hypothetical protein
VTIKSDNGAIKTFTTHADPALKQQWEQAKKDNPSNPTVDVKAGQQIGTVAKWDTNPSESHVHYGTAARMPDGTYQGVDPGGMLNATDGTTDGRDVTFTGDGGYVVGDQRYGGVAATGSTTRRRPRRRLRQVLAPPQPVVLGLPNRKVYHRPSCWVMRLTGSKARPLSAEEQTGRRGCRICKP